MRVELAEVFAGAGPMLRKADVNRQRSDEGGRESKDSGEAFLPRREPPEVRSVLWKSSLLRRRVEEGAAFSNVALSFAADVLKSEAARVDGQLLEDYVALLRGNAIYIHNFVCDERDVRLYDQLKAELVASTGATLSEEGSGLIEWSRHQVLENPTALSDTFSGIIDMFAEYFDIDVYATRLNYYRDGSQWKPQHHDSHAYGGRKEREDFTVGITLGANRSLLFIHTASQQQFAFPQKNGDCFAFTGDVNQTFTHGVPRVHAPIGDRFSIIAWGRRRTRNERNGGAPSTKTSALRTGDGRPVESIEDAVAAAKLLVSSASTPLAAAATTTAAPPKKKKSRLQ